MTGGPSDGEFAGRPGRALVTGATGAIGSAVCRLLAARGAALAALYRSDSAKAGELVDTLRSTGADIDAVAVDLTDVAATRDVVAEIATRSGGTLHTFVHAAGPHVPQRLMSDVDPHDYAQQLIGEAAAFFNVVHPAVPALRQAAGAIVAVTTVATRRFPLRDGLSPGTKASVEAVVRVLAAEEGRHGVRANCVGPGILADGMAARLRETGEFSERDVEFARRTIPLRRFGSASEIAEVVCFLVSPRAAYVTGQTVDVDGGYSI